MVLFRRTTVNGGFISKMCKLTRKKEQTGKTRDTRFFPKKPEHTDKIKVIKQSPFILTYLLPKFPLVERPLQILQPEGADRRPRQAGAPGGEHRVEGRVVLGGLEHILSNKKIEICSIFKGM